MGTNRALALTSSALASLLWMAGSSAAQHQHSQPAAPPPPPSVTQQEKALKVGKAGDVQFRSETMVGDLKLQPGRYKIQHRVSGDEHFVHFTEVTKETPSSGGGATVAHPGEVKCKVEPLDKKVRTTAVYTTKEGAIERVTKVLIEGENVAHVF